MIRRREDSPPSSATLPARGTRSTHALKRKLDDGSIPVRGARRICADKLLNAIERRLTLKFASWNRVAEWLRRLETLRQVA